MENCPSIWDLLLGCPRGDGGYGFRYMNLELMVWSRLGEYLGVFSMYVDVIENIGLDEV